MAVKGLAPGKIPTLETVAKRTTAEIITAYQIAQAQYKYWYAKGVQEKERGWEKIRDVYSMEMAERSHNSTHPFYRK